MLLPPRRYAYFRHYRAADTPPQLCRCDDIAGAGSALLMKMLITP